MNPQHAQLAISTYHGFETEGKRLRVAFACSGGRKYTSGRSNDVSPDSNNENIIGWELYVFGLPIDVNEAELVVGFLFLNARRFAIVGYFFCFRKCT